LVNDGTAALFQQRINAGLTKATIEEPEYPPFDLHPRRRLVFFYGEDGDLACAMQPLLDVGEKTEVAFVLATEDTFPLPDDVAVFKYPITLRQARQYDAWTEVNVREDPLTNPSDAMFQTLGATCSVTADQMAIMVPQEGGMLDAVKAMLPDNDRPRVAVAIYAESHYRSWMPDRAIQVMQDLVNAGCDCFVVGNATKRLHFKKDGEFVSLWGGGIYDVSGLFYTHEELASLLSQMDAMIAPDGGLMQMGLVLGMPVVGVFGPTSAASRSAYTPCLFGLDGADGASSWDCSPCWANNDCCALGEEDCSALRGIEPEKIVSAVLAILDQTKESEADAT
jgi:hypothetical protein